MSSYLPRLNERTERGADDPQVVDLDSEEAGNVLGALSSDTARSIVRALHDDPATLTEVAEMVGTSRQNAQYHIDKLESADAVEVVDTCYSEKGREMKVYAPAGSPLVIVSGDVDSNDRLREAMTQLFGGVGVLALVSVLVQALFTWGGRTGPTVEGSVLLGNDNETTDEVHFATSADGETTYSGIDPESVHVVDDSGQVYVIGEDEPVAATDQSLESANTDLADLTSIELQEESAIFADGVTGVAIDVSQSIVGSYPGLLFFLGGAVVLAASVAWTHRSADFSAP